MRRIPRRVMSTALVLACAGCMALQSTHAAPATSKADKREARQWQAPQGHEQMPLWPAGAPDMTGKARDPESVLTGDDGISEGVYDVSEPTLTVFPPKDTNSGAALVVFPGGGFMMLAITLEGTEICDWVTARGMTCVLSKYRAPRSNHHWEEACRCHVTPKVPWALQDAQRTIRLVRARAGELHIDPHKIGVIGFSAGGYLAAQTSNIFKSAYVPVDAADEQSSRPDFAIAAYPGHLCRAADSLDAGIQVTAATPPTFLVQAWDDPVDNVCNSLVYARALHRAGVPAEVHLFSVGGHGFGLRGAPHAVATWPTLVESWLKQRGIIPP